MSVRNWNSSGDLEAYETESGFFIDVAEYRYSSDMPPAPSPDLLKTKEGVREFFAMRARIHDWVETVEREPITLPRAGTRFIEPDLECFRARLLELRSLGYRFPDQVLEDIEAKMNGLSPERINADGGGLKRVAAWIAHD